MNICFPKIVIAIAVIFIVLFMWGSSPKAYCPEAAHKFELDYDRAKLIGRWEGVSNGEKGAFVFTADGRADIFTADESLKDSLLKNKGYFSFLVDTSVYPYRLDIILFTNKGKELLRFKMIFEYISRYQIRLRYFLNGDRPSKFISVKDKNTIILNKMIWNK